jgi:hypothetical protein
VPVDYRHPRVPLKAAHALAEQAAAKIQAKSFTGYEFAPIAFVEEDVMWRIFFASSQQLSLEGHIPGGIDIYIDKLDGHTWNSMELDQAYAILEDMQNQK